MTLTKKLVLLLCCLFFHPTPWAHAAHGISIDGVLKYPADFKRFDYVSDQAKQGGQLILHDLGSFDKMNPYTMKGSAPAGLTELVFETLATASLDEPFAEYGLIAKDIALADDKLSVVFTVHEKASFSNGTPITADDVAFSLTTLKSDKAHPFYQSYLQDITGADILGPRKIRFNFARTNRELHMIAGQIPIFSKEFYSKISFDEQTMTPPIASGPYVVADFNPGKSITYRKNPNYWGRDLPVRQGMFNFATITYKFYKDQIVAVEAFKAHEFDFMYVNIAKQWARDLSGTKFDRRELIKETLPHSNNQGMQGFVFNTRRKLFSDRRVRMALGLAFDFEWTNTTLFFDQYTSSASYFSNSPLAATGLPTGLELEYLKPFAGTLPPEVFTTPLTPVSTGEKDGLRGNLRQAMQILAEAGWTVRDGMLKNAAGEPFSFEILLVSPSFERVIAPFANNLKKLGISVSYRTIDPALYTRRLQSFDFDMVVSVFGQSQSPGNEQRDYWHSQAADREGSRNLAGIKDPAVDALVDRIIYAETQEDLTAACRALDRVLWYGYYLVPNWYLNKHRVAYRNIFQRPATLPLYYDYFQELMTWWIRPEHDK